MLPSNYSSNDEKYLGPVLFNPGKCSLLYSIIERKILIKIISGGPGNSGVDFVLELGTYFRAIIGPQYDLVGFDPRGQSYVVHGISTCAHRYLQAYPTPHRC
jgi:hypothetical protein